MSSVVKQSRHYLDHAATSWPKPPGVMEAVIGYQTEIGVAVGRGAYVSAQRAEQLLAETRRAVGKLIHAASSKEVYFTLNGTHSIHAALFGLLGASSMRSAHVVTTATEHNSVARALALLGHRNDIARTEVGCDRQGYIDVAMFRDSIRPNTKLAVVNHASNVTGAVQSIEQISEICKDRSIPLMVDAAQTLGYVPIDVQRSAIAILAAPGHKGCGGMLGTGILYVNSSLAPLMEPVWIGGTGTRSDTVDGPFDWSSTVESGNVNMPGIASLRAGIDWIQESLHLSSEAFPNDHAAVSRWTDQLIEAVDRQASLELIGPRLLENRLGVVSLISDRAPCHEMAMLIDSALQVEARSGIHCAGWIHPYLGTSSCSGTLRFSLGHTTVEEDVAAAVEAITMLGSL